jgi:hypothetical protein
VSALDLERFVLQQLLEFDAAPRGFVDDAVANATRPTDPDRLSLAERVELVRCRVERVEYDGAAGKIALTVRSAHA